MGVVGFQDFWVVGGRFYFKRQPVDGVVQPMIDFGVIQSVSPNFTIEKLELEDPDGGVKRSVDETLSKIDETYNLQCSNFNPDNLSILFLANPPSAFTQSAATKQVQHYAHAGRLLKLHDSDTAKTLLFKLGAVVAVGSDNLVLDSSIAIDNINASTGVITVDTGLGTGFTATDLFVILPNNLTDLGNAGTYVVASVTGDNITLTDTSATLLSSSEDMTAAQGIAKLALTGNLYEQSVDWNVISLNRGFVNLIDGGAIVADGDLQVLLHTGAITGLRRIIPQSSGEVKGSGLLFFGRGNNAQQTVRNIPLLSIVPQSPDFSADNYSTWTAEVKVLADTTLGESAGDLLYAVGDMPTTS